MRIVVVVAAAAAALVCAGAGSAHVGCPGKDVSFRAADGVRLVAHRYGTGHVFVVLAHQDGGNLCQWYPYAKRLAASGYTALPFDFRRGGDSKLVDRDVVAAAAFARRLGATKVFLAGASLGGWATIAAAPAVRPRPAGVISLSTPPQYRGDVLPRARVLTVPALFLASTDEGLTAETQALYDATGAGDKRMKLLPGDAHGVDLIDPMLGRSSWKQARTLIETFLRTH